MIVQELKLIQERCGYLPAEELHALAQRITMPLHRLHEVASFYPLYRLQPPPAVEVRVCRDISCHLRGAPRLRDKLAAVAQEFGAGVTVVGVSCLGQCDHAPAISINHHVYRGLPDEALTEHVCAAARGQPLPPQNADNSPCAWQIDPYNGQPAYEAVKRFLGQGTGSGLDAEGLLDALKIADLRGMGGAGFRTHLKWSLVRKESADIKYVICNADESEPGTFKDRELLRRVPHLVLEGLILAGLVTGAARGWVYIRHEFEEEIAALRQALAQATAAGVCGANVLGTGRSFPIELFISPGGYIQGEETALLEAMEDRRGEPRNKPPFPVTHGLYNKPTVINNVETLAWVPAISLRGGAWYRAAGVHGATGMRFVSISGDVNRPGVYEVPFGQTVRELVFDCAGGLRDGQQLKAIATSGPSGGFLPATLPRALLPVAFTERMVKEGRLAANAPAFDILNLPLDLNTLSQLGSMLGAAFVAIGDRADMVDLARNCTEFYRNESCGKCVPCRLGSQKLTEIITTFMNGDSPRDGLDVVAEVAEALSLTSICGLGMVAANPITTVLKYFPDEVKKYQARGQ